MDGSRLSKRVTREQKSRSFDDLVERKSMRKWLDQPFDCTIAINRRIRSLPPGQSVVTILFADAGGKRIVALEFSNKRQATKYRLAEQRRQFSNVSEGKGFMATSAPPPVSFLIWRRRSPSFGSSTTSAPMRFDISFAGSFSTPIMNAAPSTWRRSRKAQSGLAQKYHRIANADVARFGAAETGGRDIRGNTTFHQ
jgi:hypothetical protein